MSKIISLSTVLTFILFITFTSTSFADGNKDTSCCKAGHTFVDKDNNGVCDKYIDANNDNKCDNCTGTCGGNCKSKVNGTGHSCSSTGCSHGTVKKSGCCTAKPSGCSKLQTTPSGFCTTKKTGCCSSTKCTYIDKNKDSKCDTCGKKKGLHTN